MENNKLTKVRLKKNESFNIREGWLRKGLKLVEEYPDIFSRDDAMKKLGVGSKMVKSIKYWLLVTGLVEERITKGKHELFITEDFGKIIHEKDPYFEDVFTLYLLHFNVVRNTELAIVWNLFFNNFDAKTFTKEEMQAALEHELQKKISSDVEYSDSLFKDDCGSVLKMYVDDVDAESDPEDNLGCPFAMLGLLSKSESVKNAYKKTTPSFGKIDALLVMYIMFKNCSQDKKSVSISDLLNEDNNIGRILNMNRPLLNEYLEQLRLKKYITINRTAGLDMVYFKDGLSTQKILLDYYNQEETL